MSTFEDREKMLIDKLSATDPLGQVAQVAKHLPQAEATKILRYATSSGDAPDVVAANLNAYDKDSIGSVDWENALKEAPMTKTFLSNPLPLAIIQNKDNAQVLAGVENENKVWSAFKDGWKDAARTTVRSVQGIFDATAAGAANEQKINAMPPEYQQWSQQGGADMLKRLGEVTKGLADAKVLQSKNLRAETTLGQYGLDITRVIPQLITQMGAAVATGPVGAAGLMAAQIAGGDYEKYRKGEIDPATGKLKEGTVVDPARAMGAALGDAALQAPLEAVGLGKIMKTIQKGVPVKERVKKYFEAGATEGVTEWLQQYPQGAADIYARGADKTPQEMTQKFIEDLGQNTREGLYQGAVAFPLGVFGGAVHNAMQRQATAAYVDNIEAVQAKLAGSAILTQSPEVVEQHLEAITGGEKTYIDPDALVLYQMENPKALEELGLTEQEVNSALQTGEMVEVSKARYVTAASVDPSLHDALKDDIAPTTDGLTLRRITDRKNDKDVKRATDKTAAEDKAFKEWGREYSQQLKAAGLDEDMAKQVMVGLRAHARAMSDNPVEWLRQNAPEFRTGEGMQEGALYQKVKQSIGSAGTSLNQVAAVFKKNLLAPGTVNVDIGGGKYDLGTEHLKGLGIENLVYDPFNRGEAHNSAVIKRLQSGEIDSATVNNVLNVIKEPEVRAEVIRQAAKAIKSDGTAFFQIYEGSKSEEGRVSKTKYGIAESWQNNLPTKSYLEEVKKYFGEVKIKGNIIIAKNPVKTAEAAIWEMDGNPYFQYAGTNAHTAYQSSAKPQTETPEFKDWFGDSKVVDEQGRPLVVYHTGTMGDTYDITKSRSYTGSPDYELPGIYLTADKNESREYGTPEQTKALYVSIKNPFEGNATELHKKLGTWRKVMDYLVEQGHDGIIDDDGYGEIIAFFSEQIKSATDNSGTFNANSPNIYNQAQKNAANGSIHWENGKAIITLMQTGNPSTVIHEMVGHFFFQNLVERSKQDDAPEQVKRDAKTLLDWAGYGDKDFDSLTKEQRTDLHEKVARAAEAYIMTGKAPSIATQSLFRKFTEWLKEVYRSVRELGVEVTPEVSAVFDRMLATDAEIAEMEAVEQYHKSLPDTFLDQLTDKQRARLDKELANVRAEAEEKLRARIMQDLRADNRAAIAEERKIAQASIRAELAADPLYMARAAMQAPANTKAVQEAVSARVEEIINAQVDMLVHKAKQGVEKKHAIKDDEGYMTGEWLAGFSNNQQWYKDLLAQLPRQRLPQAWGDYIDWVKAGRPTEEGKRPRRMPPNMREAFRDIAIEHLEKGWYEETFGDIPADAEFLALRQSSPTWEIVIDNGGGLKLNEAQTREMYPDKADKLPQNMLTKGGSFDADTIAQVFGFSSGDELLARIIGSPTLSEAVNERLQAHMQQFRDLLENKDALQEEVRAAMYNDGGAALLAIEQQLIEEKSGKVMRAEEAKAAAAKARETAKLTAQRMLAKRPIIEATRLQSHIAAERRAAVDAAKFLQAKDYENAAAAKERQLINHALIQESLRIKREAERIKKYLNKQRKSKNWLSDVTDANGLHTKTSEFRDQAAAILARFGFVRKDATAPEETLAEWVRRQEADDVNGEIINIADWLAYDNRRGTVSSLTLEELQDVENAIRNIKKMATIGANSDGFAYINSDGLEATVGGLLTRAGRLTDKQVDKIEKEKTGWLKDMLAGMKQGHRLFEALDAFKSFGPWYQTFYESIKRAADYRSQLLQRVTDRLEEAFASEGIDKAERYRMAHKKIYVEEWGQSVTKNTLLAIALNTGNQGNIDRLISTPLVGIGMNTEWSLRSIKAVLEKHLTAADFRLVGKIWQAIDVYEEYNATVKRMTGNDLPKVEPQPIEYTVAGETIRLAGGYYPLSQDTRGSKQAELNAEKKLGDVPGIMPYPSTGRSKARVSGSRYAVDTDLANLYSNMTDTVQDIAFRPVAHDLNKLMRDERVVGTIRSKLGDAAYKAVLEWQNRITSGRAENIKHPLDRFFAWARNATVVSSLLLRPGVAVQNLSNVLLYGHSVDGWSNQDTMSAYMRHGWADYIPNALANSDRAKELREYVYSKSVQMHDKKMAPDYSFREIYESGADDNLLMRSGNETAQEIGYKAAQAQESLTRFASDVFAWTDQLTDIPIWLGAYEKAKDAGKTETQAVSFADAIIRNSTGTGRNLDTSWMQASGSPAMRLFTMFQTFLNTAYNRWAAEAGVFLQEGNKARLIKFVACQYLAFGVLSAVLSFKTPDDDKEPWKWFVKEVLLWPLGMIPLFGGIAKTAVDSSLGFYTYGYTATPVESKARDVLKLLGTAQKIAQGQKGIGELAEPIAANASFFFKYPDQLNDWFFNAYDVLAGNMSPELRDLVKRRPARERK